MCLYFERCNVSLPFPSDNKNLKNLCETCGSHEPLPEVGSVEDQEDEVGKVEHVRQVEHLEVTAHPEQGNNFAALR
jgi:hypothetical protein